MKAYLDIVKNILDNGIDKVPTRRNPTTGQVEVVDGGVKTIGLPNLIFSHNMKDGFPLLTCRKMPFKSMCVELEGFIRGIASKRWYQERGCKFWDQWCNPSLVPEYMDDNSNYVPRDISDSTRIEYLERYVLTGHWRALSLAEKKTYMAQENDLGPIYGSQWRKFGQQVGSNKLLNDNGIDKGKDQLKDIINKLQESPHDRRMVCSSWNPNQEHLMALPPCHFCWGVTVYGNILNLWWSQRSIDVGLGLPNNIASYALLLELLAYTADLTPGNLTGLLVDCHLYENQLDSAREMVKREPKTLPNIRFTNNSGKLTKKFHIFDWTYQDVELLNYSPHDKIAFGQVVV